MTTQLSLVGCPGGRAPSHAVCCVASIVVAPAARAPINRSNGSRQQSTQTGGRTRSASRAWASSQSLTVRRSDKDLPCLASFAASSESCAG